MINRYFQYKNRSINRNSIKKYRDKLSPYIKAVSRKLDSHKYDSKESFILAPREGYGELKRFIKKKTKPDLDSIILVGIGGSNLGAMAVYEALSAKRKLIFVDGLYPSKLEEVKKYIKEAYLKNKHCLLLLVSKSGKTTESIVNFNVLLNIFKRIDIRWKERVVIVSDEGSKLIEYADRNDFDYLTIPPVIEGRYSVFTAVGLLPLGLAGVDIDKLLRGARYGFEFALRDEFVNPAVIESASIMLSKKNIINMFLFDSRLSAFGLWWRQLIGESLGKNGKGFTPIVSMGSVDLHSVAQLYFDGPKDKYTNFISIKRGDLDFKISNNKMLDGLVPGLSGKSIS
ncbi:MAG TPA: hypothetical protein VI432_03120, partial [Candidatus Paceibacterota bacterium]